MIGLAVSAEMCHTALFSLKTQNHFPTTPYDLNSFETPTGFCYYFCNPTLPLNVVVGHGIQ